MANEQKLKDKIKTLKETNEELLKRVDALGKDGPLLLKSEKKVANLEGQLETCQGNSTHLSDELREQYAIIKKLQSDLSSMEKKVGSSSGPFPKLPTGATHLTEMSLNEDESIQLWKVATKDKANPVILQIMLNKGKATGAEFSVMK